MKKSVKKGLIIGAIVLAIIIILGFFYQCSYSKSKYYPNLLWGNVCSPKCYINQLLENTMITNKPVLNVFETEGPNAYISNYVGERRNMSLNISVLNIGKTAITYANISFIDSDIFERSPPWWYVNDWQVQNLSAMESRTSARLRFRLKEGVDIDPGVYNVRLRIICPICDEQVYYQDIPICIHPPFTDPVDSCGGIWWYQNPHWWW